MAKAQRQGGNARAASGAGAERLGSIHGSSSIQNSLGAGLNHYACQPRPVMQPTQECAACPPVGNRNCISIALVAALCGTLAGLSHPKHCCPEHCVCIICGYRNSSSRWRCARMRRVL